jgi:hypothetical protein
MKQNYLLLITMLLLANNSYSATGDTTIIVAHTNSNLAGPPSNDDIWVSFRNTGVSYQKILMKFTLGCGTPACSHWDYTVNTELGKKSGTMDSAIASIDTIAHDTTWSYSEHVDFMEVGRLITPYANYMDWAWPLAQRHSFDSSWTHPYIYDVTDYANVLKDSVNVRVHYDGWSDAFRAKVEFIFIEGPVNRTVETVREIYHMGVGYANSADFENQVGPKTFSINSNVTSAKVVVHMTGHGSQGEFDPHYFRIKINGNEVYSHILWKEDCDLNPVSPQGGTWIFHRANWCPGDKVPIYEVDITPYITPGQSATVDLDLDDFVIQNGASSTYGISSYLITYTSQKDNDVMLSEIIAPNSDKPYLHWNPISTQPKVIIKNTGKQLLTYAEISYWVKGGPKWYYEWTGALPSFQTELITLPAFDWNGLDTTDKIFYAEAKWPNGVLDEYTYNDKQQSSFKMTPKLDSAFYVYFKSNNQPWENAYVVKNEDGDTISYKHSFAAATIYHDTLHLIPGSYSFDFFDYDSANWGAGDGLQFWLNQQNVTDAWYETTGILRLQRMNNAIIKTFDGDFGANIHYEFTVGYPLGYNPPKTAPSPPVHNTGIKGLAAINASMNVFPNPASEAINIEIDLSEETDGIITIKDIAGRNIQQVKLGDSTHHSFTVPSGELAKGIYFINFVGKGIRLCKKVVVQ